MRQSDPWSVSLFLQWTNSVQRFPLEEYQANTASQITPPSHPLPPRPRRCTPPAMTPFAPTAESQAALDTVHDSLSKVRDALRDCISLQPPPVPPTPIKRPSQKVLAHAVMAKVAHDSIIRMVDFVRRNSQADIAMLQKLRQRSASLGYERMLLESQIEAQRAIKAPAVDKLSVKLPHPPPQNASEKEAHDVHLDTARALCGEIRKRKLVRDEVDGVVKQTRRKREHLATMKDDLRSLPRAVATLRNAIEPVRKLLKVGEELAASPPELAQIRLLPVPLYVLTREAFAFRTMFPKILNISLLEEQTKLEGVYRPHPRLVRMDIQADEHAGVCLQVFFRFHPELHVVTVTSRIANSEQASVKMDGKLLQLLFPYDVGETSPNPCNSHLENGTFSFDVSKAGGARPFVWANLLCGLPCLERFDTVNEIVGAGWPTEAAGHEAHIRFKETVLALRNRLCMEVALRKQLEALKAKRMPIQAEDLGFVVEPEARLEMFAKCKSRDEKSKNGLGGDTVNVVFREVWEMRVRSGELTMGCDVGIASNYPTGTPCFRLKLEKEQMDISEADMLGLEQKVNMHKMDGDLEDKRELLLSGQILTLLEGVDKLRGERNSSGRARAKRGTEKIPPSLARLLT